MVKRVLQAVYLEIRGLHQAAYILALFALASQFLALVRDRLLAYQFGAGVELDVYYTAFRIPDLLYVLFASTLSVYVLIPFVTRIMDQDGKEEGKEFLSQVFTVFLLGYVLLAGVFFISTPWMTSFFFPGFEGASKDQLVLLMRVLFLQPLFLGISSLFGVITQLGHRFVLYAVSPLLYNVGIIIGIVAFYPAVGLYGLVLGVVLGAILHMSVQIPFIKGSGLIPHIVRSFNKKTLANVLRVSFPRALTLSLHQIVFLVLVGIASVMAAGSVSVFQFAYNLQSVPLAIIGVSYSVAAFPTLAQLFSKGERDTFLDHVFVAIRHILFWSIPIAGLIVVLRAQVVRVILGTGAFDWEDTRLTAAALALFSISLVAQAINLLIVRAFYAAGNTRTPLLVTFFSSLLAVASGLVLYLLFLSTPLFAGWLELLLRVEGVPGTEILALPLGYTIALIVHTSVLLVLFGREQKADLSSLWGSFYRALAAGIMAGVGAYVALNVLVEGLRTDTFVGIFLQGFIGGVVGIVSAALLLYLVRSPELLEALETFKKRIFKTDIVVPQNIDDPAV